MYDIFSPAVRYVYPAHMRSGFIGEIMRDFIILADVTCDLSEELRKRFGIDDYIPGHVHFSDGRDFQTTLDWTNISREDFYKALSNKKMKITTAPASPEEYYEIFRSYAKDGYDTSKTSRWNVTSFICILL